MPTMGTQHARELFAAARVARLATVAADGVPHLVPVVFGVVADRIVFAVDDKPKKTRALRRLDNIAANPRVALLVDEYDDDWSQLWWVRADGVATVYAEPARLAERSALGLVDALRDKYDRYRAVPPPGPYVVVDVARWSGWRAS